MQLIVNRTHLLKALSFCQSIIERRHTIPILGNVLLTAEDGKLSLIATDLDMSYAGSIAAQISTPGQTTVSGQLFFDIVRKLKDGDIHLSVGDVSPQMHIKMGSSRFKLGCLDAKDFPKIEQGDLPCHFQMDPQILSDLIDRTKFAMSLEETRYTLNGLYLHVLQKEDGERVMRMVATDGLCLACLEIPQPEGAVDMPGMILSRKTVTEMRKLLEDETDPVRISVSKNKIVMRLANGVLSSRLIEGAFPDYQRVIPEQSNQRAVIDAKEFSDNVDRVSVMTVVDKMRPVRLLLTDGQLQLATDQHSTGSGSEHMDIEYTGQALDFGFNARYLLDISAHMIKRKLQIRFIDPASPVIFQGVNDDGGEEQRAVYVVMPMRV